MIRFGPAGWSYPDWNGVVYPMPKPQGFDPLSYASGLFDTVEINSTFYRPATAKTAQTWVRRVAGNPRFQFTAKLFRRFTHQRAKAWTVDEVDEVRTGFDPLMDAGKLGALLLQFPWSFRRTDQNREWLSDLAEDLREYPLVLEVRHESWDTADFFLGLSERGIGFVNIDQPLFNDSIGPSSRVTSPVAYVRVHGRNYSKWFSKNAESHERYDYLYSAEELNPWADRIQKVASHVGASDVYVITNNHFRGKAVANVLMLKAQVLGQVQEAPPGVVAEYGQTVAGLLVPRKPH
jgi:uncharacterized protein YecE (DUF72 family)